jgi:phosphonatase-like hydrolase
MGFYELIVFDMAGTTVRDKNEVEECFLKAANETELIAPTNRIVSMMGWSKKKVFETLWNEQMAGAPSEEIVAQVEKSYNVFCCILEEHYSTVPVLPEDGCLEVFQKIKEKGIKIALTTGFYRKVTDIILHRLGWDKGLDENYIQKGNGIIDCSVSSDQVALGRPAPYMIYRSMELLRITNVKKVIKVGDTPSDLEAGTNAGVALNLGTSYGTHTKEQLSALPNDGILGSLNEILNYLQ